MEPSSAGARRRGRFRISKLEDRIAPSLGGSILSSVTSIVDPAPGGGHDCGCDDDAGNSTSITDRYENHEWSAQSDGFSVGKYDGDGWTLFESRGGSIEHESESSETDIDRDYRAG